MIEKINRSLKDSFGKNQRGEPLFRIVWSDDQSEIRKGTFEEFSGRIFVRTVTGTKRVPKYPFIKQRYILERWFGPELVFNEELPETRQGSYEPLFVFIDAEGKPLPLVLTRIQEIINSALKPISLAERRAIDDAKKIIDEKREDENMLFALQEKGQAFAGGLKLGGTFINPGFPENKSDNK